MKKKLIACLLIVVMTILPVLNVSAADLTETHTHDHGEIEVIFPEDTAFGAEQQKLIANTLMGVDTPTPKLSFCWLVGHSYVQDTVYVVTHKVRTSSPRCLQETYNVTTCKNCSYYSEEIVGSIYIVCC